MSGDSKPERPSVSARPSARARSSNSTSRKRPASRPSRSRAPLVRALLTFGILARSLYFAISTPGPPRPRPARRHPDRPRDPGLADRQGRRESTDRALRGAPPPGRRPRRRRARPSPAPATGGSSSSCPACRTRARPPRSSAGPRSSPFHPVIGVAAADRRDHRPKAGEPDRRDRADESGQPLRLGPAALTGEGVSRRRRATDPQSAGSWFVTIDFKGDGRRRVAASSPARPPAPQPGDPHPPGRDRARRRGHLLARRSTRASRCDVGIGGGSTQITGDFTAEEAKDLALLIRAARSRCRSRSSSSAPSARRWRRGHRGEREGRDHRHHRSPALFLIARLPAGRPARRPSRWPATR